MIPGRQSSPDLGWRGTAWAQGAHSLALFSGSWHRAQCILTRNGLPAAWCRQWGAVPWLCQPCTTPGFGLCFPLGLLRWLLTRERGIDGNQITGFSKEEDCLGLSPAWSPRGLVLPHGQLGTTRRARRFGRPALCLTGRCVTTRPGCGRASSSPRWHSRAQTFPQFCLPRPHPAHRPAQAVPPSDTGASELC